jgi:hypothetical protein
MMRKLQVAGVLLAVLVSLAACSSNKSASTTTTSAPQTTTTTAAPTTTTTAKAGQQITLTPDTGLTNNESVSISGTGYPPGETLGITECADKGNQTTAGDCNLGAIAVTHASSTGTVSATYKVALGPFGQNQIVCTNPPGCLLSVSQAGSANPNAEATEDLHFSS